MKTKTISLLRRATAAAMIFAFAAAVRANPTGLSVSFGSAIAQQTGSQLTVTAGNNAVLNWQSFNIAAGEQTVFNQPSATAIVWNRVNDPNPSQIFGTIQANGVVVLLNNAGFYFGPNSFVSAAGLVVSTANCAPPQNGGGSWEFNGPPPLASIVNYGHIQVGNAGSAFLIADKIENRGTIEAPGGGIGLAAGQTVTLSERPDGRGMSLNVVLPQGSVNNYGNLIADGGTIALNAKVVNQNGLVQANSVREQNGVIELVASDAVNLGANSQILAQGDDAAAGSAGGTVTLKSGNSFSDAAGGSIVTAGGAHGGNGGNVEVSAPNVLSLNSSMDAGAQAGFSGGAFLLDPASIILGTSGTGVPDSSGTVAYNSGSGTLNINVNTAFKNKNFSSIKLQATGGITLNTSTAWDLSGSTGLKTGQLTLQAGGDITFGNGAKITDANHWSVTLQAGYGFASGSVVSGGNKFTVNGTDTYQGSIFLNGGSGKKLSGAIQLAAGSVDLEAGKDITVGSGYVITTGGGGINAHAFAGSINTGSDAQGYYFLRADDSLLPGESAGTMYDLRNGLGGISTAAGGNVNLTAGGNVSSVLPASQGAGNVGYYYNNNFVANPNLDYTTGGAGAYGFGSGQAGNVTIVAGGNVTGDYVVANGTGKIFAGVAMNAGNTIKDASGNYVLGATGSAGTSLLNPNLALSLIRGGWNVTAAQNIILQEVRNPNGTLNMAGDSSVNHLFDYGVGDYVNLSAGNEVQLGASSDALPRVDSLNVPMIYPGILNILAGAGGVVFNGDALYNQVILFPSPQGGLTIDTTGGGSLGNGLDPINGAPQVFNLIVSDSGDPTQYNPNYPSLPLADVLADHAATPVHLGNPTPIELNISGDMNLMLLSAPEAAQINVVGNLNNSAFQGMNLSADPNQSVQVQVRKIDGSMGTETVYPGLTSINVGQTAKLNMESKHILSQATDGSLTVGGDINNRSDFTSIDLNQVSGAVAPDFSVLARAQSGDPTAIQLASGFFYNPATKFLTYQNIQGKSLASLLQLLQNLTVQKVDSNGNLLWRDPENTIPDTTTVSVIDSATAQALLAKYDSLGAIPDGNTGFTIGGGGQFNVTARNMDLGTTPGIQSKGVAYENVVPSAPNALSRLFAKGADIHVNLAGKLDMYSSSIASLNGGNAYVNADGNINVGSAEFNVSTLNVRGIYTTGQGNVAVYAGGNIDVNGSRIAAYDVRPTAGSATVTPGGSVTVVSRHGNINAGNGGSGFALVRAVMVDPATHAINPFLLTIPGSGVLETSYTQPGNILVEAPDGNINAGAGGIVQLLLNNPVPPDTTLFDLPVNLDALANVFRLALGGQTQPAMALEHSLNGLVGKSYVDVYAGYELQKFNGGQSIVDSYGNPVVNANNLSDGTLVKTSANQDIDAIGSGVIGAGTVNLNASGGIKGNIFSLGDVNLDANKNINVTVLGLGTVSVASAAGSVSGTIIGVTGVSASGSSIDANLESNGSVSGNTSGEKGLAAGTAANATTTGASASDDSAKVAQKTDATGEDDLLKKKGKGIALAQKVSRVTVILPPKKLSEKTTANNPL